MQQQLEVSHVELSFQDGRTKFCIPIRFWRPPSKIHPFSLWSPTGKARGT